MMDPVPGNESGLSLCSSSGVVRSFVGACKEDLDLNRPVLSTSDILAEGELRAILNKCWQMKSFLKVCGFI